MVNCQRNWALFQFLGNIFFKSHPSVFAKTEKTTTTKKHRRSTFFRTPSKLGCFFYGRKPRVFHPFVLPQKFSVSVPRLKLPKVTILRLVSFHQRLGRTQWIPWVCGKREEVRGFEAADWLPTGLGRKLVACTLQGINISHLGKRKIIFKMPFLGDMLVPWRKFLKRVVLHSQLKSTQFGGWYQYFFRWSSNSET